MLVPTPAASFTADAFIGAVRRSAAVPNHDGTLLLYTKSKPAFGKKATSKRLCVAAIASTWTRVLSDQDTVHDANWLGDGTNAVIFLKDRADGETEAIIVDAETPSNGPYVAGVIPGPVEGLRLRVLDSDHIAVSVVGLAGDDSELHNEKTEPPKASTGQAYDNFRVRMVRHGDRRENPRDSGIRTMYC